MTTAFSYVVRGHLLRAFMVQPAGALAGLACIAGVVISLYIIVFGRPPEWLMYFIWSRGWVMLLTVTGIFLGSWLWLCVLAALKG